MNLGRNTARLAALGCLLAFAGAAGAAEPLRLTLAHGAGPNAKAHTLFLKPWAQRLAIASARRLAVSTEAARDRARCADRAGKSGPRTES